ncbi:MAG: zinc-binding dehydrogenase [Alphaproteobacteria bacterium]|nr:zinc-binding dehydrogenase [Alphaproteobacteria bacterium]
MKVRAAVLRTMGAPKPYAKSRPVSIETVELDPPGPGEVLVAIKAAGICHSDLSMASGVRPRPLPMVMGHEAAGQVEAVGPGVTDLVPGDHVALVFVPSCGHCVPCASGRPALCEPGATANAGGTLLGGHRRLRDGGGQPVNHQVGVSCYAEKAVLNRRSLVKIAKDVPFDIAALFGCAVITGVGAVVNTAKMRPGASAAVVGLGGVGLCAMLGAMAAGARSVIGVDINPAKLQLAKQLGASAVFDAREPDVVDKIRAASGGGVEYAFEMAGEAEAHELAWKIARRGGETVTAGLQHPDKRLPVPSVQLVAEERTLKGSYLGSCVPARDIPAFIDLYRSGRLPVDRLLSERIGLDEVNLAFDRLAEGTTVRQILVFP